LKRLAEQILKKYDAVVKELIAQLEAEIARKEKRISVRAGCKNWLET